MPVWPVSGHKGLCPICNDTEAGMDLETQEVISYKLLPLEHHERTHSAHPIGNDTNL
jgi:hypothetical protein